MWIARVAVESNVIRSFRYTYDGALCTHELMGHRTGYPIPASFLAWTGTQVVESARSDAHGRSSGSEDEE